MSYLRGKRLEKIQAVKKELGYNSESTNLSVQTGGGMGAYFLFGVLSLLTRKIYNLSLEEGGILLIKASNWTGAPLKDKAFFISDDEISQITCTQGPARYKLHLTHKSGQKQNFLVPKITQTEEIAQLKEKYERLA